MKPATISNDLITLTIEKENVVIRKFKVVNGRVIVMYEIFDDAGDKEIHTMEATRPMHIDLRSAITSLSWYLANSHWIDTMEKSKNIKAYGITISGYDAEMAVIISGYLTTPSKKLVSVNSEMIALVGDQYPWTGKLRIAVEHLLEEIFEYVFLKKTSQSAIEFPSETIGNPILTNV